LCLESVRSDKNEETDEENDENADGVEVFDEPISKPTKTEVNRALETMQNACLFNASGNDLQHLLHRFEALLLKSEIDTKKNKLY